MTDTILRTPLHRWHVAHQGRMVEFGGWDMPVQYSSIVEEHHATRRAIGLFDISHMGRLRFTGRGAEACLNRLLTRRIEGLSPGKIRYSLVTNESGGILDDVLLYNLTRPSEPPDFLLVVNASNRMKIMQWLERQLRPADETRWRDQTQETAMIAVQGPQALATVAGLVAAPLHELDYYSGLITTIGDASVIASRTGYTGEDGCELIVPAAVAETVWEQILTAGRAVGAKPAGLGARDTLRLEAAMPLYGHELSESIDPFQAGLAFAVQLSHEFIGREALGRLKQDETRPRRIGLEMAGKRVAREHFAVIGRDEKVGEITSGTFSPTLEMPIAMAYVRPDQATVGQLLAVEIRGKLEPARVVALPFYRRSGR